MKTINIMGTCCSRFIFNQSPINELFQVKRYAFQSALWNSADDTLGLDLDINDIEKIDVAPFTRRMVAYDFNNITLEEMDKCPSDYFMLDLMILPLPVYKINYKGRSAYTHNISLGSVVLPKMINMPEFEGLSYEKMSIEDIDKNILKEKFDLFCKWLLDRYPIDHIIVCQPKRSDKYILASTNEIKSYTDREIALFQHQDELVKEYTDYLKSQLGNVLFYEFDDSIIAFDANCCDRQPAPYHYTDKIYTLAGKEIINLISSTESEDFTNEINNVHLISNSDSSTDNNSPYNEDVSDELIEHTLDDLSDEEQEKDEYSHKRFNLKSSILKWTIFLLLSIRLITKVSSFISKM